MIYIYTPLYLDKEEKKNSKTLKLGYMVKWVGGWVEIKKKAFSFHQISLLHKIFPCRADKTPAGGRGEEKKKNEERRQWWE